MTLYLNTKANAKRIGWDKIVPDHCTGDVTATFVIHDHERGMFHFVELHTQENDRG